MRPSRRRNPVAPHAIALRGRDRNKYLDTVWEQLVRTYMESTGIVPHNEPDELLKDYPLWDVYLHEDGSVAAFVLSKETPYGLKRSASGHDGSRDGKDTAKDVLRKGFHAPGVYGETSHGVEHVAAKGDPPVVCAISVARVLGKKIHPSRDGIHYTRTITGVGPAEKVMLGRPVGIETTKYSAPACPIPPDAELLPNPMRRRGRALGRPPRMNPAINLDPYRGKSAQDLVAMVKAHRRTVNTTQELARGKRILAKHGYDLGEKLGKGTAATAFALTNYPKYVAKLTHDPLDAAVMAEVQVLGVRPGLPDVVGVADLGQGLYAIIVERLLPLTAKEDEAVETLGQQTGFGREADETVWRYYARKPQQLELLEAAKTIRALGFTPTDIGAGNVMKRADGAWVVSDFGFSKPSRTARTRDIQRLQNPGGGHPLRRNPVPTHIRSTRRNPIIDLSEFDASAGYFDVQEAVFRYAPEPEWYRDEFKALDRYALGILASHGVDVETQYLHPLGKGAMARVYKLTDDPDWVVKITTDPTDAALMAEAQFAGPLRDTPGIPKVASVFDLGPSPVRPDKFPGHVYAIVVERMQPLSSADKLKVRAYSEKYKRGWLASPEEVQKALKKVKAGSVEEAWLRGVAFVYAAGFRPTDLHASNIMQRQDGSYAFSDFGVSGVEGRAASRDIPSLAPSAAKRRAAASRVKAEQKRKTDELYAELVAAGFSDAPAEVTRPIPKRKNTDFRATALANLRPDTVAVVSFWSPKDKGWMRKQFSDMDAATEFFRKVERSPAARYVPSRIYIAGMDW